MLEDIDSTSNTIMCYNFKCIYGPSICTKDKRWSLTYLNLNKEYYLTSNSKYFKLFEIEGVKMIKILELDYFIDMPVSIEELGLLFNKIIKLRIY